MNKILKSSRSRLPQSGVPVVNVPVAGLKTGLLAMYDCVSDCVQAVDSDLVSATRARPAEPRRPKLWPTAESVVDTGGAQGVTGGAGRKRKKTPRYSIRVEYSSNNNEEKHSKLARTESLRSDEGGFDLKLPPNRFRTRSVAIVAGYCPERLYSNMPAGAFVVESGVYKVGADRDYVKSEPIYWKQVVYGAGAAGSEGSGTYPRNIGARDRETHQVLHEPRLIPEPNLELRRAGGESGARLRASSPLDQAAALGAFLSPSAGDYSDLSSVPHPSSAERSLPSTLLTNPGSSLSENNLSLEQTQSSARTRSSRFSQPSLRTIPEDSRVSVQADIHAVSEYSNLAEYTTGAVSPVTSRLRREEQAALAAALYTRDLTYLTGHLPHYDPHYPLLTPTHRPRAISPSKQYPAPAPGGQAQHIAPPRIPDISLRGVDPREVDIYQRIAQIDPEPEAASQRPLATSSPPHKRKLAMMTETEAGGPRSVHKPRFPTPPGPGPGLALSTARPPASDSPGQPGHTRVVTLDTLNLSQSRGAGAQPQPRKSSRPGVLRQRRPDADPETGDLRPRRPDCDSVSVVSEGLDAEVTAITSSSSQGSSGSNTLRVPVTKPPAPGQEAADNDRSGSSGIGASKSSSQNITGSSHSTSAGSASLHHSSLSPENLSTVILTDKFSRHPPGASAVSGLSSKLQRLEESVGQVLYENWPPRPAHYSPMSPVTQYYYAPPPMSAHVSLTSGVPPFTAHAPRSDPDTSAESPVSPGARSSRPNSSQSAPLDRSVDRHYEWDRPAQAQDDSSLQPLPPEWARRSPAYNPRRDRDIGNLVTTNTRERVLSDSEIYSNVFPRRRLQLDVEARVRAMKKEFNEFRKTQNVSPNDSDRLESLI